MKRLLAIGVAIFLSSACNGSEVSVGAGAGTAVPEYILRAPKEKQVKLFEKHTAFMVVEAYKGDDSGDRLACIGELIGSNEADNLKHCQFLVEHCFYADFSKIRWVLGVQEYVYNKALQYESIACLIVKKELETGAVLSNLAYVFALGMKWVSVAADCILFLSKEHAVLHSRLYSGGQKKRVVMQGIGGGRACNLTEGWEQRYQEISSQIEILSAKVEKERKRLELRFAFIEAHVVTGTVATTKKGDS